MVGSTKRRRDSSPARPGKRRDQSMSVGSSSDIVSDISTESASADTSKPSSSSSSLCLASTSTGEARSEIEQPAIQDPEISNSSSGTAQRDDEIYLLKKTTIAASPSDRQTTEEPNQSAILNASTQHVKPTGANIFTTGLATPSTGLEHSRDGIVISSYVADGFRYPAPKSMFSYAATETFPIFSSGDVLITTKLILPSKDWRLQSAVLARHSSWFARSMRETMSDQNEETPLWFSYSLEEVNGVVGLVRQRTDGEVPPLRSPEDAITNDILIRVEGTESQVITSIGPVGPICAYTSYAVIVEVYNQIFGAFYSIPPSFSSTKVDGALIQAEQIARYATNLDCLHLIRSHVGNALLQYRQSLFIAIKTDPARWLLLAQALQNDSIYTESLIHMIGAHPSWPWHTERSNLPEPIRHLVTRKSAELDTLFTDAERSLLLLTIEVNTSPVVPQEDSHFDTWFVVATFRDILARQFKDLQDSSSASLKRGRIFRQIRKGGSAYMVYEEMERLMKRIMPSVVGNLSEDLRLLKEYASEFVKELARNELMLDVEGNGVGYLTCSRICKEDIPWRAGGEREI